MIDKLHDYYEKKIEDNVYYPVTKNNYHKLFEYVITVEGLKVFNELKRRFIRDDKSLTSIELLKLGKLWNTYASTNGNVKEMLELDDYMSRTAKQVNVKERINLFKEGLIMVNKDYDPKQMEYHITWKKTIPWRANNPNIQDWCAICKRVVVESWTFCKATDESKSVTLGACKDHEFEVKALLSKELDILYD